jgi:hypothetical protein
MMRSWCSVLGAREQPTAPSSPSDRPVRARGVGRCGWRPFCPTVVQWASHSSATALNAPRANARVIGVQFAEDGGRPVPGARLVRRFQSFSEVACRRRSGGNSLEFQIYVHAHAQDDMLDARSGSALNSVRMRPLAVIHQNVIGPFDGRGATPFRMVGWPGAQQWRWATVCRCGSGGRTPGRSRTENQSPLPGGESHLRPKRPRP